MTVRRPIRRRLMGTHVATVRAPRPARAVGSGSVQFLLGFGSILGVGTLLLSLPVSTESGHATPVLDAFFTATSALCVTGLVVVDTQAHWNFFGEAVILALIQIGGLGYMAGASVVLWIIGGRLGVRDQYMLRLYYGAPTMGETLTFVRRVVLYAVGFEAVGALVLFLAFGMAGVGWARSVWWGIFHALSAFNNAGFNVTGVDLIPFADVPYVIIPHAILIVFGGLGAVPVLTALQRRSWRRLNLDSRLIFVTSACLILGGTAFIAAAEWRNEATLGALSPWHRIDVAFFQAVTPRTAGFSAIDIGKASEESLFFLLGLMFIGGAAGSTAGGIKVGTLAILIAAVVAVLLGRDEVSAFGRRVHRGVILQALAIVVTFLAMLFVLTVALLATTDFDSLATLFEVQSAMGTVGLSTGITPSVGAAGKVILIVGMLFGRFGPLVMVLEMTRVRRKSIFRLPEDSIRLG
ncbi:Ktr system potassium uptake protein B [bacterium HR29]|jgi:trk system potassium uptake protein TrkH|nr:Ktr system potassium uptake protein B [bacterium HR29]